MHGNGANIDGFETRDERRILPHTCFSIEPGIYLAGEFGVRSALGATAAKALLENTDLDARSIVERALKIACDICIYTNHSIAIEELDGDTGANRQA